MRQCYYLIIPLSRQLVNARYDVNINLLSPSGADYVMVAITLDNVM